MGFNCGIVGLPNVGKSTLFNALTNTAKAESANYPFCTIDPNIGRVAVPDRRLDKIAKIVNPQKTLYTTLEFVDIAGLVKGASKGEGLGNQFLGNIREVDAIIHLLRCFEDSNITHVENNIDPQRDAEIVNTELMLVDMESLSRQRESLIKKSRGHNAQRAQETIQFIDKTLALLEQGKPARSLSLTTAEEQKKMKMLNLLTSKPILYICNVDEGSAASGNQFSQSVEAMAKAEKAAYVFISAQIEQEIAQIPLEERAEYLESLGFEEMGLARVIRAGYALLNLHTFFTAGPKECRAWTIKKESKAPQAAGVIHTDFERGFICAETISYSDFIACGGEQSAKEKGKMRQEGKEYIVQDGDIITFRFNV